MLILLVHCHVLIWHTGRVLSFVFYCYTPSKSLFTGSAKLLTFPPTHAYFLVFSISIHTVYSVNRISGVALDISSVIFAYYVAFSMHAVFRKRYYLHSIDLMDLPAFSTTFMVNLLSLQICLYLRASSPCAVSFTNITPWLLLALYYVLFFVCVLINPPSSFPFFTAIFWPCSIRTISNNFIKLLPCAHALHDTVFLFFL